MSNRHRYYTDAGYSPNDGLEDGRWALDPRTRILRWVGVIPDVTVLTRTCLECEREVGPRADFCHKCASRHRRKARSVA